MYAKRFYRRRPRKYLRKRKSYGKRRSTVSKRIRRYVKREIHRNIENKERMNYAANWAIQSSDAATGTFPLIISTTQGIGDDGRIGNQIKVVRGVYKATINLLPYNVTTNPQPLPCWIKVWVLKDIKNMGQLTTVDATAYGNLFRTNGTTMSFQGTPLDMTLEINKDYFRVLYQKCFKLGNANAYSGGNPTNGASYFDNSPSAKQITINWGKWVRKQLKFTEGSTQPQNDNLYIVYQAVACDGSSSSGKQLFEIHYANYMHFEDA